MKRQIRVLQVLGRLDRGGAETMVMNLYRCMDREQIQFDFVIHTEEVCDYTEEVKRLGGKIYSMKPFRVSTALVYCRQWRDFFRAHPEYHIIHGHMRSTASLYLREAKRAGLTAIVHSHNTSSGKGISAVIKNILQYPLRYEADYLFSCSKAAGIWLYGKHACGKDNFRIFPNGIVPDNFRFDETVRERKRQEIFRNLTMMPENAEETGRDMAECSIFLHIGRLEKQKNHMFLLRIMKAIVEKHSNALLLLCGAGPLEEKIEETMQEYGLSGHVCLLGIRSDVEELMQAADGMIFPSLFEGLPVTLVEAQAAGLPVLMSDTVTQEVIITDLVKTLPLDAPPGRWAEEALSMSGRGSGAYKRKNCGEYADVVAGEGYDVKQNAVELSRFYSGIVKDRSQFSNGEKHEKV